MHKYVRGQHVFYDNTLEAEIIQLLKNNKYSIYVFGDDEGECRIADEKELMGVDYGF